MITTAVCLPTAEPGRGSRVSSELRRSSCDRPASNWLDFAEIDRLQRVKKCPPVRSHLREVVLGRRLALVGLLLMVPEPDRSPVLVPQRDCEQVAERVAGHRQ